MYKYIPLQQCFFMKTVRVSLCNAAGGGVYACIGGTGRPGDVRAMLWAVPMALPHSVAGFGLRNKFRSLQKMWPGRWPFVTILTPPLTPGVIQDLLPVLKYNQ